MKVNNLKIEKHRYVTFTAKENDKPVRVAYDSETGDWYATYAVLSTFDVENKLWGKVGTGWSNMLDHFSEPLEFEKSFIEVTHRERARDVGLHLNIDPKTGRIEWLHLMGSDWMVSINKTGKTHDARGEHQFYCKDDVLQHYKKIVDLGPFLDHVAWPSETYSVTFSPKGLLERFGKIITFSVLGNRTNVMFEDGTVFTLPPTRLAAFNLNPNDDVYVTFPDGAKETLSSIHWGVLMNLMEYVVRRDMYELENHV